MPILINTCDMNIATIPVIWMALTKFFDFSTSDNDHNASVKNRINTSIAPKNPHSSENTEKINTLIRDLYFNKISFTEVLAADIND